MKIWICTPIVTKRLDDCLLKVQKVKEMIERRGYHALSPFDVCDDMTQPLPVCAGAYIREILDCDAILRLNGWSKSRCCLLESECARIFGKLVFDHITQIKPFFDKTAGHDSPGICHLRTDTPTI